MSRHRMRERRKKHTVEREARALAQAFLTDILVRGGELVVSPVIFDAIMASSTPVGEAILGVGVPFHVNRFLPPGWVVALSREAPSPGYFVRDDQLFIDDSFRFKAWSR